MRPTDLVVRMYARRLRDGSWRAVCVDYDLEAAGASYEAAMASLDDAVVGYLETVFETGDPDSIPALLRRRAPIRERLLYWFAHLRSRATGATLLARETVLPMTLAAHGQA
ncbi:MAG: hypothetical protein K8I02_03905 [Candidatus Methylomirabilis sp.]|nr:hypothetical protein [Deltaproteobacteria bacterium]